MLVRPDRFEGCLSIIAPNETDLAKFNATHDTGVLAPLLLTKTVLPLLKR
jgi:hypothetical protein